MFTFEIEVEPESQNFRFQTWNVRYDVFKKIGHCNNVKEIDLWPSMNFFKMKWDR